MAAATVWLGSLAETRAADLAAPAIPEAAGGDGFSEPLRVSWLEGTATAAAGGSTLGVPWPKGKLAKGAGFAVTDADGKPVAAQSWPLAFWSDGSIKWSAHAVAMPSVSTHYLLRVDPQNAPPPTAGPRLTVSETADAILVETGRARWSIAKTGDVLIREAAIGDRQVLGRGRLVCSIRSAPTFEDASDVKQSNFHTRLDQAVVEQNGPARAVVKLTGVHIAADGRNRLPFVVRLYWYSDSPQMKMMHSFVYDADEKTEFIASLGVRFDVPMRDAAYDRHVRFAGEEDGVWAEAVQGVTGLRRDPGKAVRDAQMAGVALPPPTEWATAVSDRLKYVPTWGDYSLRQFSADGFDLRKRTKPGHAWIPSAAGGRAAGVGYIGGVTGGMTFGLRDFWQRHPTQLDVRNANTDLATVTLWLWSPEAPAMDLRFYHDGLGQETHEQQLDALNITYEDYEPGFGSPKGIARTSELFFTACDSVPSRQALADFAGVVRRPPQLVASPATLLNAGVFGGLWSPVDRGTPAKAAVEDRLASLVDHYLREIDQRHWYGFWDYGDVMHEYDPDRHVWRYDVGGYAWDNSELSPDLWLWYTFLRTGRADVFRLAEAMTRHTGEVDVYHAGDFKGLGSRHNVQHWGCSAKQLRISTVIYRRFFYYLTADERVGDLMRDLVDADQTFMKLDPIRKIRKEKYEPQPNALAVGFGTDWGSIGSALYTEWERTGDERLKAKLIESMKSIGAMPFGFFSGGGLYNPATGKFAVRDQEPSVSHLSAVFGLPEIAAELTREFDVPEFEKAWLDYCEYYNAPRADRNKAMGFDAPSRPLTSPHSRLTAWAAVRRKKPELASRAWNEFLGDGREAKPVKPLELVDLKGPAVLRPIKAARVSTNDSSQWSLAAIQLLALVGDAAPAATHESPK